MSRAPDIEQLYRTHGHIVLRRAEQLLGSSAEAHELLQEIFTSLVERPEQFRGGSSITTWLYSAATHASLNRIRDRRTRKRLLEQRVAPAIGGDTAAPTAEASALARDLLSKLPEDLAVAAVHYYLDEMTHDEIAAVMGCSRRHVGNLLERLRSRVGSQAEEL